MTNLNLDKTVLFKTIDSMKMLADPLVRHFDITYFGYIKSYADQSHIALSTSAEWMRCFYTNFHKKAICHKDISAYRNGYFLWSEFSNQQSVIAARNEFNIANGIILIDKREDFCEFYGFATTPQNSAIQSWYLSNLDLLEKFIYFFKNRGKSLIKLAETDRYILPNQAKTNENKININPLKSDMARCSFLKEIESNSYISYSENIKNIYRIFLTRKEISCSFYLLKGLTIKEIAKELKLSPRTVETHLNHVKNKLDARNLTELAVKLIKCFPDWQI